MKIALTGATGNLGKGVLRNLVLRHAPGDVIACVRNPDAAPETWREWGVTCRKCDYDDPMSMATAFRDVSKLLLISSPHPDDDVRYRHHVAAIEAAKEAGVECLVYTSIARAERGRLPLHRLHLDTEQALRESGLSYVILRNAYYMDIVKFLGVREAATSGELWSPPGDWAFNTVARDDLALATATVLTEEGHEGRTYELVASKLWTLRDLAAALTAATGRQVRYRTNADMKSPLFDMLAMADMKFTSTDLERLTGGALRTVADEVRDLFR
ncbi:NmrA family NAD(P)-binding protein [Cohnella soli]|uniref:NmrA family NAD(P)-binding protein n=1 Tax=Cohnella soli TaxID=425005 RepID=A0ABW0HQ01_9BACL